MWYSQRDPRWSSQRLGTVDGVTLGSDGCYTTALANLASDCGKDINPAQLDDIFTNQGLYVSGDLCYDGILTKVYGDISFAWSKQYAGPADLSQLNNDITVKQILEVDGQPNNPGLQTHFVYFYDYNNGIVRVIDSWTGQLINLADVYGDPATCIYAIITYTFNPPTAPPPAPVPHDPVAVPPTPEPIPAPLPTPVPQPQPVPEPQPEPAPAPTPTPSPQPEPTPVPTPEPNPAPTPPVSLIGLIKAILAWLGRLRWRR